MRAFRIVEVVGRAAGGASDPRQGFLVGGREEFELVAGGADVDVDGESARDQIRKISKQPSLQNGARAVFLKESDRCLSGRH